MKPLLIISLVPFMLATAIAQPAVVRLYNLSSVLTDSCTSGNPLPDGTMIEVFHDADDDGPDWEDTEVLSFFMNGEAEGLGRGLFTLVNLWYIPSVPPNPFYYLRACRPTLHWTSAVLQLVPGGIMEIEVSVWSCLEEPCLPACPSPPPGNFSASDDSTAAVYLTWEYPDTISGLQHFLLDRDGLPLDTAAGSARQYIDTSTVVGWAYLYRIRAVRSCGTIEVFSEWVMDTGTRLTNASEELSDMTVSRKYTLLPNYPNPFNAVTRVEFTLSKSARVMIRVSDVLGRDVGVIADDVFVAGRHSVNWRCADCASGVYFITMQGEGFHLVQKAILLR